MVEHCGLLLKDADEETYEADMEDANLKLMAYYLISRRKIISLPKPIKVRFSFNMIDPFCGESLRFRTRADVVQVYQQLNFPREVKINNAIYPTDHLFYVFLIRLSSSMTFSQIIANPLVGGEKSKWSRGIYWMARHIHINHGYRLNSFAPQVVALFPTFAQKTRAVANDKGANFPMHNEFLVAMFVDCNITRTSVPGTGPVAPGPDQARRDPTGILGTSVYNQWGGGTGFKCLTVDSVNGLTLFASDCASMRRNDNWVRQACNVETLLLNAQVGNQHQYLMYGDSIFPWGTHLRARHHAPPGHPHKQVLDAQDRGMSSCRMLIENHYGEGDQLFPFSKQKSKLKIQTSDAPYHLYFCRLLLRNMHICLYENKTSKRFDCPPPSLATYMSW